MSKEKIWLSSPHMGGTEQSYINEAFKENWVAPLGPNVTGFEKDIQNFLLEKAENKGSKDSLIMVDNVAYVVSVENKTVITAIDDQNVKENVFTNIDSAVFM